MTNSSDDGVSPLYKAGLSMPGLNHSESVYQEIASVNSNLNYNRIRMTKENQTIPKHDGSFSINPKQDLTTNNRYLATTPELSNNRGTHFQQPYKSQSQVSPQSATSRISDTAPNPLSSHPFFNLARSIHEIVASRNDQCSIPNTNEQFKQSFSPMQLPFWSYNIPNNDLSWTNEHNNTGTTAYFDTISSIDRTVIDLNQENTSMDQSEDDIVVDIEESGDDEADDNDVCPPGGIFGLHVPDRQFYVDRLNMNSSYDSNQLTARSREVNDRDVIRTDNSHLSGDIQRSHITFPPNTHINNVDFGTETNLMMKKSSVQTMYQNEITNLRRPGSHVEHKIESRSHGHVDTNSPLDGINRESLINVTTLDQVNQNVQMSNDMDTSYKANLFGQTISFIQNYLSTINRNQNDVGICGNFREICDSIVSNDSNNGKLVPRVSFVSSVADNLRSYNKQQCNRNHLVSPCTSQDRPTTIMTTSTSLNPTHINPNPIKPINGIDFKNIRSLISNNMI